MPGSGIWLPDDIYQQTAGQLWSQQQTQAIQQRTQAGQDWATQAMQDTMQRLQSMVPTVSPTPAPVQAPPTPAPVEPPPPVAATPPPAPPPAPIAPAPAPETPPAPTPTALPSAAPPEAPPSVVPETPPVPTPAPVTPITPTDTQQTGENWAQQQIDNLLNPSPAASQTPQPQTPVPGAAPAATQPTAPQSAPATTPGAPAGPQPSTPGDLIDQTRQAAMAAGIDPNIFARQIQQESNFNPNAKSGAGAQGIAQFMPATAQGLGINAMDPSQALPAAANLMKSYLDKAGGNWASALSMYNAGPGNTPAGGVAPFAETQNYVNTILGGAKDLVQQGVGAVQQAAQNVVSTGQTAVNSAVQAVQSAVARTSQFAMGLSSGDAMAFCGPAAAMAFAQTYGRNPTVDEAKQLAQQVGWNSSQGMAGVGSEVKLLNAMGVDAHATQGVDWKQVGQDASGGNPVIIDTPGHYYYVDGYNADTGKFHVGTSGTDLKGGSEWMSSDQINAMPQSGGAARSAVFADHPLSGPGQAATMGANQPATSQPGLNLGGVTPSDVALGLLPFGPATGQALQTGQTLISSVLNPPSSPTQAQASTIANAVLNVGQQGLGQVGSTIGQTGQDLLNQAQSVLSPLTSTLGQAPQSLNDMLTQNALISQGIPTVQGALSTAPDLSAQGIAGTAANIAPDVASAGGQILANVLGLPNAAGQLAQTPQAQQIGKAVTDFAYGGPIGAFNQNLRSLGQDVLAPPINALADALNPSVTPQPPLGRAADWLSQQNVPVLSGVAGAAAPTVNAGGVLDALQTVSDLTKKYGTSDSSQYSSEDQQRLLQASTAIGGMTMPAESPGLGDWIKGAYKGGVIGGLNTMADVVSNATLTPALSGIAGAMRDLASFQPGRLQGRALGAQAGIVNWTDNFLQGLSNSLSRPGSLSARTSGVPGVMANLIEGAGALHGAFQNATSELIQSMERGAAAGASASEQGLKGADWLQQFHNAAQNPAPDVFARAKAMGDRTAARGDLGQLTGALGSVVGNMGPIGDALFPVYRMGMSLASRMVESTPLGLAGTIADVGRGLAGRGPYAALQQSGLHGALDVTPAGSAVGPIGERLTNNLIGTALSMWLANQAVGGAITGDGPSDPGERQVWLANGNQPNSFRLPNGNYYSWEKLAPALKGPMMAAGAYADAVQAYNQARARQGTAGSQAYGVQDPRMAAAAQLVSEVGQQLMSATPLRTFANLYDTVQSGASTGQAGLTAAGDIASSILGGAVPFSGTVRSIAQMTDPLQRQTLTPRTPQELPQSVLENVLQNIPGARENLPVRPDVLGRPTVNPLQGLGEISPIRPAAGQPAPLLQAMENAGVAPSAAPRTVDYGPYEQIALTPAEQRAWQQIQGQILQQSAAKLVASPGWQTMAPRSQATALQLMDSSAAHAADLKILGVIGGPALQTRREPKPGGALAPVTGYSPDVMQTQMLLEQQLQRSAQNQALINSLLA